MTAQDSAARWRARPLQAGLLRTAAVVVPLACSVAAGVLVGMILPDTHSWVAAVVSWLAVLAISTVVLFGVDRLTRRLLPIATLLKLSMLFPDRAPSRYKVARTMAGSSALAAELERARQHGVTGDRQQAAETVLALVGALGEYDSRTRGHSERTQLFVTMIAEEMGLRPADRDRLLWAALIHDVGKLRVPSAVLNKPAKLDAAEWEILRRHPLDGATICGPLNDWLGPWGLAVEQHHERYDGTGYPLGLSGERISLGGRIVAVADSYEVMTAARAYKKAMTAPEARAELARCAGSQFDPAVVRAFLAISLSRLRWVSGPLAWLAQIPFMQSLPGVGQAVSAVGSAALTGASLVGLGVAPAIAAVPPAAPTAAHASSNVRPGPTSTSRPPGDAAPRPTGTGSTTSSTSGSSPSPTARADTTTDPTSTTPAQPGPANRKPAAGDDRVTVAEDSAPKAISVLANDVVPDNGSLSVISTGPPSHGHVSVGATTVTYAPAANYNGLDHFTYTARDQNGDVATATVTVTVTAVNDAPQARDDRYAGQAGHQISANVLHNDLDVDGDALQVTGDDSAAVHLGATGGFSITPAVAGTITVHYLVSDGHAHDTGTLRIVVTAAPGPSQPSRLYLRGSSTSVPGDLTTSAPTAGATDWDGDKHPGLTIRDSDLKVTTSDPTKYQQWSYATPSGGLKLNGPVSLDLWSTPRQRKDQDIDYSAWLYSCNSSGGSCQLLTSATNVRVRKWSTTTTWQRRTIGIGSVSTTVPSGRLVKLRLEFHRSDMWLALDAAHPSSLIL